MFTTRGYLLEKVFEVSCSMRVVSSWRERHKKDRGGRAIRLRRQWYWAT